VLVQNSSCPYLDISDNCIKLVQRKIYDIPMNLYKHRFYFKE